MIELWFREKKDINQGFVRITWGGKSLEDAIMLAIVVVPMFTVFAEVDDGVFLRDLIDEFAIFAEWSL